MPLHEALALRIEVEAQDMLHAPVVEVADGVDGGGVIQGEAIGGGGRVSARMLDERTLCNLAGGLADPEFYVFSKDVPFTSPSAAANAVAGGYRNGRTSWRHESSGLTYVEWTEKRVEEALRG